ncbi:MAG: hypothetical protein ACK5ZG_06125 [Phycisphaerae bacterium]|jgi:hypothetical protein
MDGIAPVYGCVCRVRSQLPVGQRAAWISVWLAGSLAVSMQATGCGGRNAKPREVDTSIASLLDGPGANQRGEVMILDPREATTEEQKAAWAKQAALNHEALMQQQPELREREPVAAADVMGQPSEQTQQAASETTSIADAPAAQVNDATQAATQNAPATGLDAMVGGATETTTATAPGPETSPAPATAQVEAAVPAAPVDPLVDTASRMAALLRQRDGSGKALITDLAAILPVESMRAGVLATLGDAGNPLASLSDEDKSTLIAARDRLLADPSNASNDLIKSLRPASGLMILRTALCTRVEGFGRFDPYSTSTFVQGRTLRAIVYVELDGFATRPARDSDPVMSNVAIGDQVSVDLTQSLSLYHDADDLLAWHRPARGVIETSRNKRRDFYLIQQIDLPPTLTVGRYNMKVTVTDRTTQAQAEAIIPIEIVAHESALRGR